MILKFLTPSFFQKRFRLMLLISLGCFLCTLPLGLCLVFFEVPDDYLQGQLVKIMYIHVPAAWLSLLLYSFIAIFSSLFLVLRNPFLDVIAKSFAKIGAAMALTALITGAIWGKPAWGTWWVWDARLTSTLILFCIYIVYILLHGEGVFSNSNRSATAASVFAVVGLINIPIIKYSVYMWNTLHQGVSVLRLDGPSIHPSMLYPLLIMFIGFLSFAFIITLLEIQSEVYERKAKALKMR